MNEKAKKPVDRVERFYDSIKSNKIISILIIAGIVLIAISNIIKSLDVVHDSKVLKTIYEDNFNSILMDKLGDAIADIDSIEVMNRQEFTNFLININQITSELEQILSGRTKLKQDSKENILKKTKKLKSSLLLNTHQLLKKYHKAKSTTLKKQIIGLCNVLEPLCFNKELCTKKELEVIRYTLNHI